MIKLFGVLFAIIAPTLMGSLVLIVLIVPELAAKDSILIAPAAGLGMLLAIPPSYLIAKKLLKLTKA